MHLIFRHLRVWWRLCCQVHLSAPLTLVHLSAPLTLPIFLCKYSVSLFLLYSSLSLLSVVKTGNLYSTFRLCPAVGAFSPISIVVRWPLLFISALVWQVRFATSFYLPRIKTLVNYASTVVVSNAIPMIVGITVIGHMNGGRR